MTGNLSDIVHGDWQQQTQTNFECYARTREPEYLALDYDTMQGRKDGKAVKKARVLARGPKFEVEFCAYGETLAEALRDLIDEWGDDIERYAGTIHPNDL